MAGACAVCLVLIAKDDKFVLLGTEVVHPQCLSGATLATKMRQEVLKLRRDLAIARTNVKEATEHGDNLARARERELAEIATLRDRCRRVDALVDEYRAQRDNARSERDRAFVIRDEAIRQAEAARREAALHQTISRGAPPAETPAAPEPADDRDPAEIRFSLLDIDPL